MEPDKAAPSALQLSFNIFQAIRAGQAQHGLKHGDYQRYRRYCARRLSKLRTLVKFHHGRQRFQKKELKLEMVVDNRWIELLLLGAERAWAYGHEIKQEIDKAGYVHTNKRRHMLRRFSKARKHAEVLVAASLQACDVHTQAEAAAYLDWLTALELFEKDRQIEVAAGHFLRAQRAIRALSNFGGPAAQSACRQKAAEIDAIVRICLHKAAQAQGDGGAVAPEAVALPRDDVVDARIDELLAAAPDGAAAGLQAAFEWHGERFVVQNEEVAGLLDSVHTLREGLAARMDTEEDDGGAAVAAAGGAAYAAIVDALLRAQKLLADELEASSSGAGALQDLDSLVALHAAVTGALAEAVLQRYTLQGNWMNVKFKRNMAHAMAKSKHREKGARAEDCIRLFDGLVKAALELDRVATLEGVPPPVAEALVAQSDCYRQLYSAARCYYIAHLRLAKGGADNQPVAWALFEAVEGRLAAAEAAAEGIPGGLPPQQRELLDTLTAECAAFAIVAQAEVASTSAGEGGQLASNLKGLGLEESSAAAASEYLTEHMFEWKSFAGSQPRIFRLASLLETIPMRPITLDTALQFVVEPDVSHRCPAKQKAAPAASVVTGLTQRLFGWGASTGK